jgi:hypothetical protein
MSYCSIPFRGFLPIGLTNACLQAQSGVSPLSGLAGVEQT